MKALMSALVALLVCCWAIPASAGESCANCESGKPSLFSWFSCPQGCKTCVSKTEPKDEPKTEWSCECVDICLPGKCGECGDVRTVKKLVKRVVPEKKCKTEWEVIDHGCQACGGCAEGCSSCHAAAQPAVTEQAGLLAVDENNLESIAGPAVTVAPSHTQPKQPVQQTSGTAEKTGSVKLLPWLFK